MIKIREKEQTKNKQRTTKNNIHDTQTFGVQDKTDNVLIGFAEFLDSLKESAFKTNKADNLLKIICLLWYNWSKILREKEEILHNAGQISAKVAQELAYKEYDKFKIKQDKLYKSDFDDFLNETRMIANGSGNNG